LNRNGLEASIREGLKSQYDVVADGEVVFSKQAEGRWPDDGEVQRLLSSR
jgi:hypothetical protein